MKLVLVVAFLLSSTLSYAAGTRAPVAQEQSSAMTNGEVRKVDKGQGKVTIRHEPLKNLDMPAMTMVFRVKDPTMLEKVKDGDRIRFVAERIDGAITVVQWEPAG